MTDLRTRERPPSARAAVPEITGQAIDTHSVGGSATTHRCCAELAARVEQLERRLDDLIEVMAEVDECSEVWACLAENDTWYRPGSVHPDDDTFAGF